MPQDITAEDLRDEIRICSKDLFQLVEDYNTLTETRVGRRDLQSQVLTAVLQHGRMRAADLCRCLGLTHAELSHVTGRLIADGRLSKLQVGVYAAPTVTAEPTTA